LVFLIPHQFTGTVLIVLTLLTVGTIGYRLIEGPTWSLFDALYMTGITLTTVGFLEVHELSSAGRLFTLFLCFGGIFTLFFTATEFIRAIVSGELRTALGKQIMEQQLAELDEHVIVCGYGRMGTLICEEFEAKRSPYVLIDRSAERVARWPGKVGTPLVGDATQDETLLRAGVQRARAVITALPSDADNLYVALSARLLNDKVRIIARAEDPDAAAKLTRVGANQVILPYVIGGQRAASAVLRPTVVEYLDSAARSGSLELQIEEVTLSAQSRLTGKCLADARLQADLGIIIVAVKRATGVMQYNPRGDTVLDAGSTLVALGHRQQLDELERWARG
jgi:voltage-gated potassium channel